LVGLSTFDRHDPVERYLRRSARLEKRSRLRIMTPSETVDLSIKIYQRLAGVFIRESVAAAFLALVGVTFIFEWTLPSLFETSDQSNISVQVVEFMVNLAVGLVVGGPLILVGGSFLVAVVVVLTSQYLTGAPLEVKLARATAQRTWKATILTSLAVLAASSGGIFASVLVMALGGWMSTFQNNSEMFLRLLAYLGVIALVMAVVWCLACVARYALALPSCILENVRPRRSLSRSVELQKKFLHHGTGTAATWYVLITVLIGWFLITTGAETARELVGLDRLVTQFNQVLPYPEVWKVAIGAIPSYVAILLLLPAVSCGFTIIYFERRVRLEGYDIDALASEISA
jgi:hypothetical protein